MNVLDAIDPEGEVTRIASEAQIALDHGDTASSGRLFDQAAQMLESAAAGLQKPSDQELARFLAASHYYLGGHYDRAAELCKKIRENRLAPRHRRLFPAFVSDVKERSTPGYKTQYCEKLIEQYSRATTEGDRPAAQTVIEILIHHPYLISQDLMAHLRARCCEVLGQRHAATLFHRDAWRFNPAQQYTLPKYLDSLCKEGRHDDAWKIVEGELTDHPGARSSICAMFVINAMRIRDSQAGSVAGRRVPRELLTELLKHFQSALGAYQSLPPEDEEREKIALLMDNAFSITWVAYLEFNDPGKQRDTLTKWVELRPDNPVPRVLRGMMTYPEDPSKRDFREAIELKSSDPLPYYFLAYEALQSRDFSECDRLCTEALKRNPEAADRAELVLWKTHSRRKLGLEKPPDRSMPPALPFKDGVYWRERAERYGRERAERYGDEVSRKDIEEQGPQRHSA